jgi:predicted O-methyltransferase YrrM
MARAGPAHHDKTRNSMSRRSNRVSPKTTALFAGGVALAVIVLSATVGPAVGTGVGLALVVVAFKVLIDDAMARRVSHLDNLFTQYECLEQLYRHIQPVEPFPSTRSYRGSPDFLLEIYQRITRHRPRVVVEGSSGLSTVVCGYALQRLGQGEVIALEHEARFTEDTRQMVARHGLSGVARVCHAPIVRHDIRGQSWLWYDFKGADLPDEIDLIVIDGPPSDLQKKARYPALPLLIDRLKVGGLLLLDDAARGGERRAVEDWQAQFPNIAVEQVPLEKGLVVVTKTRAA